MKTLRVDGYPITLRSVLDALIEGDLTPDEAEAWIERLHHNTAYPSPSERENLERVVSNAIGEVVRHRFADWDGFPGTMPMARAALNAIYPEQT